MVEENRLTSKFFIGLLTLDTNLKVDEVNTRFSEVTSHKTSLITVRKQEVYDNPDKYLYSGHVKKDELFLYNLNTDSRYATILHGKIKTKNSRSIISIWIRPNLFIIAVSIFLLYIIFGYGTFVDFQEIDIYALGLLIVLYWLYLMDIKTHKKTLKELFNLKESNKNSIT